MSDGGANRRSSDSLAAGGGLGFTARAMLRPMLALPFLCSAAVSHPPVGIDNLLAVDQLPFLKDGVQVRYAYWAFSHLPTAATKLPRR